MNEVCGIELPESAVVVETRRNKQGEETFRAKIGYRGPLAVPTLPRVLFDITRHEIIATVPANRPVFHPYPDDLPTDVLVTTYSLEELFAEKTRALHERMRPRDLYDVVQLVENYSSAVQFALARQIFTGKCAAKKITPPASETLAAQVCASTELEADWKAMLAHQLPALPPLDGIRTRVAACLTWLDEATAVAPAVSRIPPASVPPAKLRASDDEEIVAPPGGTFWGSAGPLELVRFAGSNRLLITFSYHGKQRVVQPYSLRRHRTGNLLLYAWEEGGHHIKAFKVREMFGIAVTDRTFIPRFLVELSAIA